MHQASSKTATNMEKDSRSHTFSVESSRSSADSPIVHICMHHLRTPADQDVHEASMQKKNREKRKASLTAGPQLYRQWRPKLVTDCC